MIAAISECGIDGADLTCPDNRHVGQAEALTLTNRMV